MGSVQRAVVLALDGVHPFELGIPGQAPMGARKRGAASTFREVGALANSGERRGQADAFPGWPRRCHPESRAGPGIPGGAVWGIRPARKGKMTE